MLLDVFRNVIVACLALSGLAHGASASSALATGHRLMRERRYDEAVVYLQAALGNAKRPGPVAKYLAFCFARTGQYDDAIALLERLCEAGKMGRSLVDQETHGIRAFIKARSLADSGQFAPAAALLEPIAARSAPATQLHLDAVAALGDALFAQSEFAGAADAYQRAAEAGERWAYAERALIRHVRSLLECHRPAEAITLLDEHHAALRHPLAVDVQEIIAHAFLSHADSTLTQAGSLPPTGRLLLASQILTRGYDCLVGQASLPASGSKTREDRTPNIQPSAVVPRARARSRPRPTSNIQRRTDRRPETRDRRLATELRAPSSELATPSHRTAPASASGLCLPPTRLFERLAQVQTNLAQLWLDAGQAALDAGHTPSATEHFWRATEDCPHADRPVWLRAKKAHNKLHWAAHEQLNHAFKKHLRGRDFASAAQAFHDVAWTYPYTTPGARAFYFEAKCLRDLGKPAQAETLFKSFLKKHSHSHLASTVCYQLGQQAAGKGKPRDALKWYERALDKHPNGANADMCAFLIAVHHWERKHYQHCAKLSEHLLAHYPKSPLCPRAKLMLEYVKRRAAARRKVGQAS